MMQFYFVKKNSKIIFRTVGTEYAKITNAMQNSDFWISDKDQKICRASLSETRNCSRKFPVICSKIFDGAASSHSAESQGSSSAYGLVLKKNGADIELHQRLLNEL